jgi:hypothetical protein
LRVDVVKKDSAAASSKEGEFDTSTTTDAPPRTSSSPCPDRVSTPVAGEAATVSWPCSVRLATTLDPMSPVPPMTTILMVDLRNAVGVVCGSTLLAGPR